MDKGEGGYGPMGHYHVTLKGPGGGGGRGVGWTEGRGVWTEGDGKRGRAERVREKRPGRGCIGGRR